MDDLILRAVGASLDRKGMSFYVIKKELSSQGYDVESKGHVLRRAMRKLMDRELIRTSGQSVTGTFKVNKAKTLEKKTKVKSEQLTTIHEQAKKSAAAKKPEKEVAEIKVTVE